MITKNTVSDCVESCCVILLRAIRGGGYWYEQGDDNSIPGCDGDPIPGLEVGQSVYVFADQERIEEVKVATVDRRGCAWYAVGFIKNHRPALFPITDDCFGLTRDEAIQKAAKEISEAMDYARERAEELKELEALHRRAEELELEAEQMAKD